MKVLTNDPSMTAWGWAVVLISANRSRILDSGCIKTKPEHKKKRIRKSDDYARRLGEISQKLIDLHDQHDLDWIVSEAPHGSQHASGATMRGAVLGILSTLSKCIDLPIEWYSERDAKKHMTGRRSVTKKEMIDCIINLHGDNWCTDVKYRDEAIADAMAVFHVAQANSQALIYARNQT